MIAHGIDILKLIDARTFHNRLQPKKPGSASSDELQAIETSIEKELCNHHI